MNDVTVVIPTSSIPSHPSTEIIDTTVASIRKWLPHSIIMILADGLREEQEHRRESYENYLHELKFRRPSNIHVYEFRWHVHQVGMLRAVMNFIFTPFILFVEHDTPLVTDEYIPFPALFSMLEMGTMDFVRFLPEAQIHPEHMHLMCGQLEKYPLTKTIQFSARPHIATKNFYERALACFSPDAKCFIEDKMHSICQDDPWEKWRMTIYTPHTPNQKRSLHLDGRAGTNKFDDTQKF